MSAAKHVVIRFAVGRGKDAVKCRLVVGGVIEVMSTDGLGEPIWIKAGKGMPDKEVVYAAALRRVFDDLSPFADNQLYPLIDVGDLTPNDTSAEPDSQGFEKLLRDSRWRA